MIMSQNVELMIFQSNYTSYGSGKPLTFLDKFREGWMAKFQKQILYVFLPFFPKVCRLFLHTVVTGKYL